VQVDGIKIDVQGMEFQTLLGMEEVLKTHKPKLIVEFHAGVDRKRVLDFLGSIGYTRQALPIEPVEGEVEPQFLDDHSYFFAP